MSITPRAVAVKEATKGLPLSREGRKIAFLSFPGTESLALASGLNGRVANIRTEILALEDRGS